MKKAPERSVAILAPHPFFIERGTPIAVRDLAEILSEGGWKVTIVTLPFGDDPQLNEVELIRTFRIPFVRFIGIGLSFGKLCADVFLMGRFFRMLFFRRFTVYHAVEEAVFVAWWIRLIFPAKLVYDMDSCMSDQIVEKFPRLGFLRSCLRCAERFVMKRVDWILPVCPALEEIAGGLAPLTPRTTLHDVPPPRGDFPQDDLLDLKTLVGAGSLIALYVGNFEKYQGVDLLIDAMKRIPDVEDLELVLIGGGKRQDELERQIRGSEVEDRVHFTGPQPLDHLPFLLDQADILVSPRTKGVNTPMKVYSYLAAGKPLLATRILSHTQILSDDVAFLAEASEKGLADGLLALRESSDLRQRLGGKAKGLATTLYSREELASKILGAYEQLM
ncbi:MAG: glycosyltransferase [Verrucomicrobiota bacterium]